MSQVAIVIDLPHQSADVVGGNSLTRAAEDFARAVRKSHPVDDQIRLVGVYVSDNTLIVDDGSFAEPEPEVTDDQFQQWGRDAVAKLAEPEAPEA